MCPEKPAVCEPRAVLKDFGPSRGGLLQTGKRSSSSSRVQAFFFAVKHRVKSPLFE